jgi:hypothetical protein
MNEEKEDALPQEVEDWLGQPYTRLMIATVEDHKNVILRGLLAACKQSTDPKVALWYARYEAKENVEQLLKTGTLPV